jgi:hypothetical protein
MLRRRLSPRGIGTLARRGDLVRVGRGIYVRAAVARRLAKLPDGDHLLRAGAAVAQNSPGAVLSHRSAALLHGIDLIGSTKTVTITAGPGRARRSGAGVHVYTTRLRSQDMMRRYGLPVTTPARTVIDLARTLPLAEGVVAADSAIRKRLTSVPELRAVLAAGPRRRGNTRAVLVAGLADGRSESALESIARVAFGQCGLPPPDLQVWLPPGQPVGRVDFYWEKYQTIAEVDGAMKYEDPVRAKMQLHRDKLLREAGYEVVHFDWREITTGPALVAGSIRAAFRRGSQRATPPAA